MQSKFPSEKLNPLYDLTSNSFQKEKKGEKAKLRNTDKYRIRACLENVIQVVITLYSCSCANVEYQVLFSITALKFLENAAIFAWLLKFDLWHL